MEKITQPNMKNEETTKLCDVPLYSSHVPHLKDYSWVPTVRKFVQSNDRYMEGWSGCWLFVFPIMQSEYFKVGNHPRMLIFWVVRSMNWNGARVALWKLCGVDRPGDRRWERHRISLEPAHIKAGLSPQSTGALVSFHSYRVKILSKMGAFYTIRMAEVPS